MAFRGPYLPEEPSSEVVSHFESFPWTATYFNSPAYIPITNIARFVRPPPSKQESFLSLTLNTPTTIIAWQNFHTAQSSPSRPYGEFIFLIKLGSDINGHENVAHGGFVGVLLDEVIGTACEYQKEARVLTMTAYLNVGFKRPVPTPGVVLLRGWVEKREGRKVWGKGTVEDGEGNVLTTGEALFVAIKEKI